MFEKGWGTCRASVREEGAEGNGNQLDWIKLDCRPGCNPDLLRQCCVGSNTSLKWNGISF